MASKTEPKGKQKSIPSHLALLTIAQVTMPEPDRMTAAKRWLGAENVFTNREKYLLKGFWLLLDGEPKKEEFLNTNKDGRLDDDLFEIFQKV